MERDVGGVIRYTALHVGASGIMIQHDHAIEFSTLQEFKERTAQHPVFAGMLREFVEGNRRAHSEAPTETNTETSDENSDANNKCDPVSALSQTIVDLNVRSFMQAVERTARVYRAQVPSVELVFTQDYDAQAMRSMICDKDRVSPVHLCSEAKDNNIHVKALMKRSM